MSNKKNKLKSKSHSYFDCNECSNQFEIGSGGFLGSLDDFEFQMSTNDKEEQEFLECSPFMSYIQLCKKCYEKRVTNIKK
ncbi:hypothetical protein [Winogradskyella sp.]|uniref:hypothetical protein n=1 Tax=Winogradskyella sp. TaxID=1883156 RepID=UPI003F69B3F9